MCVRFGRPQLGFKVACVEREFLGGTCLNIGCIPSKALLDSSEKYAAAKNSFGGKLGIEIGEVKLDLSKMMQRRGSVVKALTDGVGFLFKKNKIESIRGEAKFTGPVDGQQAIEVKSSTGTATYSAKHIIIATGSAPLERTRPAV